MNVIFFHTHRSLTVRPSLVSLLKEHCISTSLQVNFIELQPTLDAVNNVRLQKANLVCPLYSSYNIIGLINRTKKDNPSVSGVFWLHTGDLLTEQPSFFAKTEEQIGEWLIKLKKINQIC